MSETKTICTIECPYYETGFKTERPCRFELAMGKSNFGTSANLGGPCRYSHLSPQSKLVLSLNEKGDLKSELVPV